MHLDLRSSVNIEVAMERINKDQNQHIVNKIRPKTTVGKLESKSVKFLFQV